MNEAIFRWINGWPEFFSPLFLYLSNATKEWPTRIALSLLFVSMLVRPCARRLAIVTMISWPIANGITDLFKGFLPQARPCQELAEIHTRIYLSSPGTASAHSANMAAVATCFVLARSRWGWVWGAIAVLTGVSRMYVGVHYPSQVVLGWLIGIGIGSAVTKTSDRFWPPSPARAELESES